MRTTPLALAALVATPALAGVASGDVFDDAFDEAFDDAFEGEIGSPLGGGPTGAGPPTAQGRGALRTGVGLQGILAAEDEGWDPDYVQVWVGPTTPTSGWLALEAALVAARRHGATPVVEWYYWGDSISPACVVDGCDGRSRADWMDKGRRLGDVIAASGVPAIVVVETEFNKNGVGGWEPFDGLLAAHLRELAAHAPSARLYVGFGSWGTEDYHRFDRAMAEADGAGLQLMRASTRNDDESYAAAPQALMRAVQTLHGLYGKPILLHDLALSSYGDKEELQASVLTALSRDARDLRAAGLEGVVWRETRDDPNAPADEYFGAAEREWGLRRADGTPKPAWEAWQRLGGNGARDARPAARAPTLLDGPWGLGDVTSRLIGWM